jgi:oligopeptide/dipeptide ABC transporter ATP-binding protein
MSAPLLQVEGLSRHFRVGTGLFRRGRLLRAVEQVSFELEAGQAFGLVGESGCGKSTLGRALLRLIEPTAGRVRLDGIDITALDPAGLKRARKHMQMIFQDPYASLSPRRTVDQILREPLDLHRIGAPGSRSRRVSELLDIVGLRASDRQRYPHEFSGGQRQRIGIARALAVEPRLIVADEAVSALDVSVQSQVLNLLADLKREFGIAFVFISHDLAVVQHVCDRVGVMYLGRLVENAPVDRLYRDPAHPYTRALLASIPEPDPLRARSGAALSGELPSPLAPPPGCPFHPRCPVATAICAERVPRTIELDPAGPAPHRVRCHRHDTRLDQEQAPS